MPELKCVCSFQISAGGRWQLREVVLCVVVHNSSICSKPDTGCSCRLPPISKKPMGIDGQFLNRGFAFQAPAWGRCRLHEVMLRKVFRQQSDQKFLRILQDIRHAAEPFRRDLFCLR